MKKHWSLEELVDHWTLAPSDIGLLKRLAVDTKLVVAVMLKACAIDGVFPRAPSAVPFTAVDFIARQLGISSELLSDEAWMGRSGSRHRARIRDHLGFVEYDQAQHRSSGIA